MYLNGVSVAAVLRALSAEREVKERCPVISWGRSARQENIRRGGSIELSGPQQRWSACYTVGNANILGKSNMLYLLNATIFPFCLSIATLQ